MNWFQKLLPKTHGARHLTCEEVDKKWKSWDYFNRGRECCSELPLSTTKAAEALSHFDSAILWDFAEYFRDLPDDLAPFYGWRATCLQRLGYHFDAISDFDRAISLNPDNLNDFYMRSISKGAVLDFDGQISDLNAAISLSKKQNGLNTAFNDRLRNEGFGSMSELFQMALEMARTGEKIWEKRPTEHREQKLRGIKRR